MKEVKIVERSPSPEKYNKLRELVGWHSLDIESTKSALSKSLFSVSAIIDGKVIGFGRVIGDGIYFYIQDVVISPEYQKKRSWA